MTAGCTLVPRGASVSLALVVVVDFVGLDPVTGGAQFPLQVIWAHAQSTLTPPSAFTFGFEARLNGTTLLTDSGAFQSSRIISNTDFRTWWFVFWLWNWTSGAVDPVVSLNDQIEFRAFANDGSGLTNSAFTSPANFVGQPSPLPVPTPQSYTLGTAHAGLTGFGSIAVSSNVGVLVFVTAFPTGWGFTQDNPLRSVPSFGQISWSDANGSTQFNLVHYEQELIFNGGFQATHLQYSFKPGWVVTLTELV